MIEGPARSSHRSRPVQAGGAGRSTGARAIVPHLASYIAVTALFVITPGAATAVVIRNAVRGGRAAGFAAAAGAAIGNTTFAVASGLGVSLLLLQWPAGLRTLRICGAVFLATLGLRSLWHARRAASAPAPAGAAAAGPDPRDRSSAAASLKPSFVEGLFVNLLNPAVAVFYVSYVTQFVPAGPSAARAFAMLASIHVCMALICHSIYAITLGGLSAAMSRPHVKRVMDVAIGLALLGLAVQAMWKV